MKETQKDGKKLSDSEEKLLNKLEKKTEPFSKAAIAYRTLSDPNERKKYDREKGIKKSCSASDPRKRNGCGKKEEAKKSYQAPKTNKEENIESDLLDAIHQKDLQRVKVLISKLNDLEKLDILSSMSYLFVENACSDDDWFKFFEEILSSKQINLGSNYFYNIALKHACNANNRKVMELILIKFLFLKKQYQFITH